MRKTINVAGLDLIRGFEGLRLTAYPDPGTGDVPWTIGFGHTGADVHKGLTITRDQADDLLFRDLEHFERFVEQEARDCSDNQFAALVSFAFNCGTTKLSKSTLLKKHNAGDYTGAQAEFGRWNRAAGKIMAGLTRRRAAEAKLYGA